MEKQEMVDLQVQEPPDDWDMVDAQRILQSKIAERSGDDLGRPAETVGEILQSFRLNRECIEQELAEFLDFLPFKHWKRYDVDMESYIPEDLKTELKYELIDVMHFCNNIALSLGMDGAEVRRIYHTKWVENMARQERGY